MDDVVLNQPPGPDGHRLESWTDQSRIPTKIPKIPGLELAVGAMLALPIESGGLTGGDFFDVFRLNGGYGLSLGAIAGRSEKTAALARVAKFTLEAEAFRNSASVNADDHLAHSVDLTMRSAGALLSQTLHRQANLSLLYGNYEPQVHCLTFCNCSRWPPALLRNGQVSFLEERHAEMGQSWHRHYPPVELNLEPGDVFVAYTDGLPEVQRGRSIMGIGPIRRVLQESAGKSGVELAQQLIGLPRSFCRGDSPIDDAVVLVAILQDGEGASDGVRCDAELSGVDR